ncbi:respiratory nitrate reductase gamma subunit [Fontibacillus phaseoli]|uniref:Respiratory nitrate reductase gamma subunit n=1 Tax=Fontibacillus phaseoli TaxID=1416533 RepID=A0A369B771_9BACL|nr:respiratory nitrate reductase subunit gamma [Fontibacillus phaseoli]RCX17372.1 respiratory nitrate reductase gamma subunit [Fontibacillus phaseoli]
MTGIFWWVVFPYITLTVMIVGLLYRFAFRQVSWTAPSTEIFEKKWLKVGSTVFHYGIIFAFIGHIMGVLIPRSVYHSLGVSDETYHVFAIAGGGLAGLMVVGGLVVLLIRKLTNRRVRVHAGFGDYFAVILVLVVAAMGTYMTLVYNTTVVAYEYRTTIGPWFRSLFILNPQYHLMEGVPFLFQLHIVLAFLLFASIPFTHLVHMFSLPARYPARAPQQYRSRINYKKRERT